MELTPVNVNFSQGLNTKVDPWQLPPGQFLRLINTNFDEGGLLKKRNGYGTLPSLPDSTYAYLTTLNDNLTAIGPTIGAYNSASQTWTERGQITPLKVGTLPVIRNSVNQSQCDVAIAANGLMCAVYTETTGAATSYKYAIANSVTGQNIVAPTLIPAMTGVITGSPRVFVLGNYFLLVFTNVITAVSHLQYISISSVDPTIKTTNQDLASAYISATTLSWDGIVFNDTFYVAYNTTSGGQSVKLTSLSSYAASLGQAPATPLTWVGSKATMMTLAVDTTVNNPVIYVSFYDSGSSTGYTGAINATLAQVLAPTQIIASGTILNLASAAQGGSCTIFQEVSNNYSYAVVPTHYVQKVSIASGGSVGATATVIRSVGLGSKAFIISGQIYFLSAFQSPFQPSYFLINGSTSTQAAPVICAKLAYENGGGYLTLGLPSVQVSGTTAKIAYLYKDLIQALTTTNTTEEITTGGIYSQTGVNLGSFNFTTDGIGTAEIAKSLHLSGGFLGLYDGYLPVEHGFFVWPDSVVLAGSGTGGVMTAQKYYYQALYEWADNQGNIHRSAGSIPVTITTTGSTSSVTVNVPTLRVTMKTANPAKIVIYRWSTAQPVYHQITSLTTPTLNSTTSDSIAFVDTVADATISGNSIIYTTGGVVENIAPPATNIMTLFDTRLWTVSAEDPDLLCYSKQVIEATPVEMSDLLTIYVAPNTGTVSTTGPVTALCPMDDKLVIFKGHSIYYIGGTGPDNTGANSQYTQPIFITSTVGSIIQSSLVLMNDGIMFQSDKGIWLLGRGLDVKYIGAAVDSFNDSIVNSAQNIPGTNEVRLTLNTGQTLMYDYYYSQWGTFKGASAISSCIYGGLHTYINQYGEVYQETPGRYVDGSNPVLIGFTTGWINVAALQGFERFKYFYFIGRYLSPHTLNINLSYDYIDSPFQNFVIRPTNFSPALASPFGSPAAPFGSETDLEQWKIHARLQKCQSFQISLDESYDPTLGVAPGAGLTLSGINMLVAVKRATRPIKAVNTVG